MSIAQRAGDGCTGQKQVLGCRWGAQEGLGVQMGPGTVFERADGGAREGLGVQMGPREGSWGADGGPGGKEPLLQYILLAEGNKLLC